MSSRFVTSEPTSDVLSNIELPKATTAILGRAKRVVVDADYTTILGGAGDRKAVEGRCTQIRQELEQSDSEYDR